MNTLTPNLIVDRIEPCLDFYVQRAGFEKITEVPAKDGLGFVILKHGGIELMLQSRASIGEDIPPLAKELFRAVLYIEVSVDALAELRRKLGDVPRVIPDRKTWYGADEILVKDPAGNLVVFAARAESAPG